VNKNFQIVVGLPKSWVEMSTDINFFSIIILQQHKCHGGSPKNKQGEGGNPLLKRNQTGQRLMVQSGRQGQRGATSRVSITNKRTWNNTDPAQSLLRTSSCLKLGPD